MYDITGAISLCDHLAETSKPIIIYGMVTVHRKYSMYAP